MAARYLYFDLEKDRCFDSESPNSGNEKCLFSSMRLNQVYWIIKIISQASYDLKNYKVVKITN